VNLLPFFLARLSPRRQRRNVKALLLPLLLLGLLAAGRAGAADTLEQDFAAPPDATRVRCYWYWIDGHITKEGITKDLEAMKRVGIGEGYIGIISGQSGTPSGQSCQALTDEWWSNVEHAIREGGRLGVDIGLFNSPGWSQSGGPWVKPEQAMRFVVLPEKRLRGPQRFEGKLPAPPAKFQDLAVLAFPAPAGEEERAKETARTPTSVAFEMPTPFTARSVTVQPTKAVNVTAELQASDDGREYRTVKKFTIDRHNLAVGVGPVPLAPVVAAFPATTARFFRLDLSAKCELGDIQLSPAARVESYAEKSLQKMFQEPHPPFGFYSWPPSAEPQQPELAVQPGSIRDLSKLMAADGTLRWEVPDGDWIVLRAAMTPTGTSNSPAPPEATGPEVDKMNRAALKAHFDAYVGALLKRLPASERKAWKHVVADSFEQGPENWTDGFRADFRKRYGYDPVPWLPVMTGRILASADQSDRFLWDLRRLVADRIAQDYVGGLRDLCHQHGLKMWLENYGHWGFPSEFLQYGGACDEISGEFWANGDFLDTTDYNYLGRIELRDAASAAHIYGKPVVWAESFTGGPAFVNTPGDLKARGDWAFCEGINQFLLHVYIHQPWEDKVPGVNAWFGTEFNRHNTWFEQGKAWVDYLRRCTVLLQAGQPVADIAYFIGEDAPKMDGERKPALPAGRDFDFINADVIEKYLTVKNGVLTLPRGISYRVLVLPDLPAMRPEVLRKIRALVKAGATVVGKPPSRSPSLAGFPNCDERVRTMAREVWGEIGSEPAGEHKFGKGRVVWGRSLEEILLGLGSQPDFENSAKLLFKHRRQGGTDIYFVANPTPEAVKTAAAFRAAGRVPELWSPDSGQRERLAVYEETDGVVRLPLCLGPQGSTFVVFREKPAAAAPHLVSVVRDGTEVLGTNVKPAPAQADRDCSNNFTFALWVKPDAETTLVREANDGIVGMSEPRNEVLFPPHGSLFGGPENAGSGLSVGRNGVCVFEHGPNYFAATLVQAATLTNWTHVTVVYRDGQPSLYLNGLPARTGLKSKHVVHCGVGHGSGSKFGGLHGDFEKISRALSDAEVAALAGSMPCPKPDELAIPPQVTVDAAGGLVAQFAEPGAYELKFADGQTRDLQVAAITAPLDIGGPWEVSFAPGWGAPEKTVFDQLTDWTKSAQDAIKYFSGQATYRKSFDVPYVPAPAKDRLILDLGEVHDLATVRVNGRELVTLWHAPWQVDVTSAVRPGGNELEITVVNAWRNRLAGDAALPPEKRLTYLSAATVGQGTPLLPAGLLGPVTLRTSEVIEVR
jgi:hypothetical protein